MGDSVGAGIGAACGAFCGASLQYFMSIMPFGSDIKSCDQCCRCNCGWDAGQYPDEDEDQPSNAAAAGTAVKKGGGSGEEEPLPRYEATPQMDASGSAGNATGTTAAPDSSRQ